VFDMALPLQAGDELRALFLIEEACTHRCVTLSY
jgi:hypothetical protein